MRRRACVTGSWLSSEPGAPWLGGKRPPGPPDGGSSASALPSFAPWASVQLAVARARMGVHDDSRLIRNTLIQ
jgi:hypothetical protein